MEERVLKWVSRPDYTPLNVPELLRALGLARGQQQDLQAVLAGLERAGANRPHQRQSLRAAVGCRLGSGGAFA